MANSMFGIHAASIAGIPALMENVAETVRRSMYAKLSASPIPSYMPIPPFRFLDDSEMPIVVSMNDANDDAIRL